MHYTRRDFLNMCTRACLLPLMGASLVACKKTPHVPAGSPLAYASFFPVYDLAREVAGDAVEIRSFMPANKDPHLWEPTPKALRDLSVANLLIINGANMEHWVDQVRDNISALPMLRLSDSVDLITYKGAAAMGEFQYMARLEVRPGTYGFEFGHTHQDIMRVAFIQASADTSEKELIKLGREVMNKQGKVVVQHSIIDVQANEVYALEMGHESGYIGFTLPKGKDWLLVSDRASEDLLSYRLVTKENGDEIPVKQVVEGASSGHDKITFDPHSWLSLNNAKHYCNLICDCLSKQFPDGERGFRKNKVDVVSRLTELDAEYQDKFADLKRREFVVTHNAYAYLCRDLGIRHFPLQGLTSTEAPALKTVRKAVEFCRSHDVNTVFYELGASSKGADAVAGEIGGRAAPLASMEYVSEEQGAELHGYVEIMRSNLEAIYQSLV